MGPAPADEVASVAEVAEVPDHTARASEETAADGALQPPAASAPGVARDAGAPGVESAAESGFPMRNGPAPYELPDLPAAELVGLPGPVPGGGTADRSPANGTAEHAGAGPAAADGAQNGAYLTERERTVLELLQTGAISFDKAAAFLKISPEQLSARLAQLALRG
jgi:DNA-binding CsgD family transcriptional regulator